MDDFTKRVITDALAQAAHRWPEDAKLFDTTGDATMAAEYRVKAAHARDLAAMLGA